LHNIIHTQQSSYWTFWDIKLPLKIVKKLEYCVEENHKNTRLGGSEVQLKIHENNK